MNCPVLLKSLAAITLTLLSSILLAADWTVEELPHIDGTPLLPHEGESSWVVMEITETEDGEVISAWLENQGDIAYLVYTDEPSFDAPETFTFGDGYEVELKGEVNLQLVTQLEADQIVKRDNWEVSILATEIKLSYPTSHDTQKSNVFYIALNGDITLKEVGTNGSMDILALDSGERPNSIKAPNQSNVWEISGSNSGGLNSEVGQLQSEIKFEGFEILIGGDITDDFILNDTDSNLSIDGGQGQDTLASNLTSELEAGLIINGENGAVISSGFVLGSSILEGGSNEVWIVRSCTPTNEPEHEMDKEAQENCTPSISAEIIDGPYEIEATFEQNPPAKKKKGGALAFEILFSALLIGFFRNFFFNKKSA